MQDDVSHNTSNSKEEGEISEAEFEFAEADLDLSDTSLPSAAFGG